MFRLGSLCLFCLCGPVCSVAVLKRFRFCFFLFDWLELVGRGLGGPRGRARENVGACVFSAARPRALGPSAAAGRRRASVPSSFRPASGVSIPLPSVVHRAGGPAPRAECPVGPERPRRARAGRRAAGRVRCLRAGSPGSVVRSGLPPATGPAGTAGPIAVRRRRRCVAHAPHASVQLAVRDAGQVHAPDVLEEVRVARLLGLDVHGAVGLDRVAGRGSVGHGHDGGVFHGVSPVLCPSIAGE